MRRRSVLVFSGWLLAFGLGLGGMRACAATPAFALSASNMTFPLSGGSSIPFTLTSVDGYTGTVAVDCSNVNAPARATVPVCGGGAIQPGYTLASDAVVQGSILLTAFPVPAPASEPAASYVPQGAVSMALAGVLLFSFGLRRRSARRLLLMLAAVGTLAGVAGV